ncbi:hypothetical protein CDCA_CDCA10G2983 [Cyanidium caldarium]|uniref:Aspartate carbamoyltransferase n=1 Tax=Cyanidium caldarium TaxID=2771 RepID=A0AAV9IYS3_CYACA|nr:hypothetical protein CDCA_CDCA10G2983 [Cyanidium caldarium]
MSAVGNGVVERGAVGTQLLSTDGVVKGACCGRLVLADGTTFAGECFGALRSVAGEVVFQTGMVGYEQALTDPSYRKQLLVFTYPLIGNYGVPNEGLRDEHGLRRFFESDRVHVAGVVVMSYEQQYSHWNAVCSLGAWLERHGVVGIAGVDTRRLTQTIREHGSVLGRIVLDGQRDEQVPLVDPNQENLVAQVSCAQVRTYGAADAPLHVVAVDCGLKYNQLRCLLRRGCRVTVVPWDYDFNAEALSSCDGLFLSNGPGDPTMVSSTVAHIRTWLAARRPVFGICLGHQLLSLAAGCRTYKLKFGNRGQNIPCIDERTGRCYITSQNHGYAVDASTLPDGWRPLFTNANDGSNEGIIHGSLPFFSVQFHPEACAGPEDTEFLFDAFVAMMRSGQPPPPPSTVVTGSAAPAGNQRPVRKVLILGSGGLSIGQAGEFDYSGSQAVKAMREEGIYTVLINPNIATVQTSPGLADKVYFLPVDPDYVIKVAENERPDGMLLQFGGQTALNCGIELFKRDFFRRLDIRVLGTPIRTIMDTEDRELFNGRLAEIGEPFALSASACSVEQALQEAERIGYPVIARAAFALGGLGSGFANDAAELKALARKAFSASPQVLVERSMKGWKEIEYEVVRDAYDNCITVCNMENFDPLGVHTGESIVVAPSQTLSNAEYQMLRNSAIKTVRHLGVVGECNIQFALNPRSREYCIIEVNARLSRSSALASKATGYPLAFVAAKLALGKRLPDIRNSVTRETTACFEPSLDYLVVKMPRWDLRKFERVTPQLGSSMKSVGEVMAIGRTFEETIQKAIRMVRDYYVNGFEPGAEPYSDEEMCAPTEARILALASGLADGRTVDELHRKTQIDRWFLYRLERIAQFERELAARAQASPLADASSSSTDSWLSAGLLWRAKQLGFSDRQLGKIVGTTEVEVRKLRLKHALAPNVKQIDTVAAEFPAQTNYLYMTYSGGGPNQHDVPPDSRGTIVLGSGAYRIGSSVEFDWCAVSAIRTLRAQGACAIMINYNPETVSTDYDECDRLYFEELSFERVMDIHEREMAQGVVVSMGGQIPNNIAMALHRQGVRIYGTTPEMIDTAENRYKFSRLLDRLGVDQPRWKELTSIEDAKVFCETVGYPCLVRPSYVLSGAAMNVAYKPEDLERYLSEAAQVSREHPVVISKFILEAKEIDVDAVARKGELLIHFISEHVENAGVHSGDATLVLPAQDMEAETVRKIEDATRKIANALNVTGPMNIQFIAKNNEIKVIECNVRASRSFPFVSKTAGIDLAKIATKVMLGRTVVPYPVEASAAIPHVGVKVPMFSFTRLLGADPILGVEMASTGEVACYGETREEAYLKGLVAAGIRLPQRHICLSIGSYKEKLEFLESAKKLAALGFRLFATPGTADFLAEHDVSCTVVVWPSGEYRHDTLDVTKLIHDKMVDFFINLPSQNKLRRLSTFMSNGYLTRRTAVDFCVPLLTNIKCAKLLVRALARYGNRSPLPLQPHDARFSSRVITLPGLACLAAPWPVGGVDGAACFAALTEQALAGGFTVLSMAPSPPLLVTGAEELQAVRAQLRQQARCDYAVLARATRQNAAVLRRLAAEVAGLYISLPSSTAAAADGDQDENLEPWLAHLESWPPDKPVLVHADGSRGLSAMLFGAVVHSRAIHAHRIRRRADVTVVRAAKQRGIAVTCDVDVRDLLALPEQRGLRSTDVDALWESLDVIDAVTGPPDIILGMLLEAVHVGRLQMSWVQQRLVTFPMRLLGLAPSVPASAADASYIEVDIERAEARASEMTGEPYTYLLRGRLLRVVLRGRIAYLDGRVYAEPGSGRDGTEHAAAVTALEDKMEVKKAGVQRLFEGDDRLEDVERARRQVERRARDLDLAAPTPRRDGGGGSVSAAVPAPTPPLRRGLMASPVPAEEGGWRAPWGTSATPATASSGDHALIGRSVLSVSQFGRADLHALFGVAQEMRQMVSRMGMYDLLRGRVMALVFFEPSTRTASSFAAAMQRLGGTVIQMHDVSCSSVAKGESLEDTVRTMASYADVVVLRHPEAGSAVRAARHLPATPLINAGDGVGEHPTQALLDVFTIREELGTVNGLVITFVGDLKHGRTVHSLARLLSLYQVKVNYVSPRKLCMPSEVLDEVASRGVEQREHEQLDACLGETDCLYVTRVQRERFADREEYEAVKSRYVITPKTLTRAKERMIVMHPLPRVSEISAEVDSDPRAVYFRQVQYGVYVRMALLSMILGRS